MGLFTRDCYDEDRDARIKEIGQEAYDKEIADMIANAPPRRWSNTEPRVTSEDIIQTNIAVVSVEHYVQMYISRIDEEGNIWGRTITNAPQVWDKHKGAEWKWEGDYIRVSASLGEYDTSIKE